MDNFDLREFCGRLEGMNRETIGDMIEREINHLNEETKASTKESGKNALAARVSYESEIESLGRLLNIVKYKQAVTPTPDENGKQLPVNRHGSIQQLGKPDDFKAFELSVA